MNKKLLKNLLPEEIAFSIAANNKKAKLNNRNEFLREKGLANVLDNKKDSFDVKDDRLFVSGFNIRDINRELEKENLGELTILPTAAFVRGMGNEYHDLDSTELNVMNPGRVPYFAGDKGIQHQTFWNSTEAVGHYQPTNAYTGKSNGLEELEEDLEFFKDVPMIEQPRTDSGGNGIRFFDNYEELISTYEDEGIPEKYIVQAKLPVKSDIRVISARDQPISAMARHLDPESGICNLSNVEGDSYLEKAEKALEEGYATSIDVEEMDPAINNILEDHYEGMIDEVNEGEEVETFLGWDFFVIDSEEIQEYPEEMSERFLQEQYRLENGDYLVYGETNSSPGRMIDVINRDNVDQDSAFNLASYGDSVARDEEYSVGLKSLCGYDETKLRDILPGMSR